ncbi:MAG: ATP-binding protein [Pseudonocardiaceae bacterium]
MPGRVRELGHLQAEQQRSMLGELRVALLLGDAGLGKTRLAAELLPHGKGAAVGLTAHSCLFRGMPPFGAWADALGLQAGDPHAHGVCRTCGSGLGGLPTLVRRAEIAHDAPSCAEALRYHFVEWIPGLVARASADRPIVMVLEDAHLVHDAVWKMLLRLARDFPASHIFVLATARPAALARNRRALEVLQALEQEAEIRRVQLAPFSRDDTRQLAEYALRRDRVPATLVDWLMAHAQGNPLFTVSLLEALVDNGADMQAPALRGVPDALARWVRTELAQLDPSALALIELLAVVGDLVDPGDLAQITGRSFEDIALALERLVRSGMVVEQQHDQFLGYRVAHPIIQEVLYTDIGGARRRVLHRRVAGTLLESGWAQAAASHFVRAAQAGDNEAITALIEMAQRAQQRGLCSQVWKTVSTLRDLLPIGDERWLEVFDALFPRSNWGVIDRTEHFVVDIAAVRRVRQLLAGVCDLQRQADVRLWLAGLFAYGVGDLAAGERECRQALTLCRRTGCDATARWAGIELAKMRSRAGDLRGAEVAARQRLSEAERAGDQRGIAEALGVLGHTLGWQGRFDAAEDVLVRSVELATASARFSWMSQSLALLASFDACRGHLVSARTRWAQAAASSPRYDPVIGGCGAFIELVAGDLVMSAAHARQAEGHDPAGRFRMPARLAGRAAIAAAERGCLTEARQHLHAMARTGSRTFGILEPLYWWAQGAVARGEGRLAVAGAAFRRSVDRYSAMNSRALRAFVLADLAEVTVMAGDSGSVQRAAAWAEDNARDTGAPIHQTLHLLAWAWALIGRGRHDQAAGVALRAADGFSSRGYLLLAARARVAYASAIRRSDRGAAEEALRNAAVAFDTCGAVMRHEQVRTLLSELGSSEPCAAEGARDSLTRRERQVAELAAGGYTAPQIAARLHIGVRTVETHLARSYPKLGIASKQQLVHRAAEFGFTSGP